MRIALVLILFLVVILPFSAQSDRANSLLAKGQAMVQERQFPDAIKNFQRAATIFRKKGDQTNRVKSLLHLTHTYILADEYSEAQSLAEKILQLTPPKDTLAANAYDHLGTIQLNNSQFEKALNLFEKALDIRKQKLDENHLDIAESYSTIGITQKHLGRTAEAAESLQFALNINRSILGESHPSTAKSFGELGAVYSTNGDHDRAIQFIQQGIDTLKKYDEAEYPSIAHQYFHLGEAYMAKGIYDLGLMNTERGLTVLEIIKGTEHPDRAPFLNNIGKIYSERGEYTQALDYYQQALDVVELHRGTEHSDISQSYNNIAVALRAQGQLDSALVFFKKSLDLNEKLFGEAHPRVAQSWSDMGATYFELEKYDQALAYYNNAFSKFEEFYGLQHMSIARVEQQIGKVFLKKGGLEVALGHFQNSLNANVPFLSEENDISKTPSLDQALDKNVFLSALSLKAQTLTTLFKSKEKFSNLELAFNNFLLCDSLIDEIRRSFIEYNDQLIFNQTASQVYEEAIYTCLILNNHTKEKKYIEQAFYFSEKSKSNALLQSFSNDEALRFADMPDSLEALEIILKINISVAQKKLKSVIEARDSIKITSAQEKLLEAKEAYNQFVINLENEFPHYYQLKYDKSVASLQQVQDGLKSGTTLLEYMSGEKRIFIFSITPDEAFIDLVNKPSDYDSLIFTFRKSITDIDYITHSDSIEHAWKTYTSNAYGIYKTLLDQPLNHFSNRAFQKLIIIPDGKLGYLPFEILLQEKPKGEAINYTNLNYVLHNYSISYAFSGTMLLKQQGDQVITKDLHYGGFAPIYSSGKLSFATSTPSSQYFRSSRYVDLPASRKGVEYIAKIMNGNAFLAESATEAIFKDTVYNFDILHLAMHGVYDDKNPLNSHLVFTQSEDEKEDNFLTAAELYNLNSNASLVFLGACNSGYGKINRGEGIMSLSRSFAYAGCPSIVMSLWSVPDDETASITNYFFQRIKNGASKDEALRQAKLQYLTDSDVPPDRQHPLFWAGFVPIGDMTPLYAPDELSNNWTLFAAISMLALTIFFGMRLWKNYRTSTL